jgi:hypothetical protein
MSKIIRIIKGGGGGIENAPKRKQAFCFKQSAFLEIEDELCAYVIDFRKIGCMVYTKMLQLEASKIPQKLTFVTEFKASYRPVRQFLSLWQLLIHRGSQKLREVYEEKLTHFQKFVILVRKECSCFLS